LAERNQVIPTVLDPDIVRFRNPVECEACFDSKQVLQARLGSIGQPSLIQTLTLTFYWNRRIIT
jgi:hypothetical protein